MNQKLVHICVNYHNDKQTSDFLLSLFDLPDADSVSWVLVNNSAKKTDEDNFAELVQRSSGRLVVLNCPENRGYFGGAEWARKQLKIKKMTVVSNTDLEIMNKDFYSLIFNQQKFRGWGCLAPRIISSVSGNDMNPYMKESPRIEKIRIWKKAFSNYFTAVIYQLLAEIKYRLLGVSAKNSDSQAVQSDIYAPHGSLMVFSDSYFEGGGTFDHPCFLFGEEFTVAENCKKLQLKVVYLPSIKVKHYQHGAIGTWANIFSYKHFQFRKDSAEKCYSLYFGV